MANEEFEVEEPQSGQRETEGEKRKGTGRTKR